MPCFYWTEAFQYQPLVESTVHAFRLQPAYTFALLFAAGWTPTIRSKNVGQTDGHKMGHHHTDPVKYILWMMDLSYMVL